ncbi:MAG: hypothetical protein M3209_10335 [Acidobacteriota bacterium]|nr:hypothetical protein [Acidobacteriota bacterium]
MIKIFSTILGVILLLGAFVFVAEAQQAQRRKQTTRRTNSTTVRPQPSNSSRIIEAEVVSTAGDIENNENGGRNVVDPSPAKSENGKQADEPIQNPSSNTRNNAAMQREIQALREQVKELQEKRGVDDLEKLSVAEERAENFRRKLEDTIAREADLNAKLQQLEYQSRPEAIQLETATIGSTRPEEVRETRRKMLEAEKTRIQAQINQVQISRARLEAAITNADSLVEKLRARVEADALAEPKTVRSKDAEQKKMETTEPPDNEELDPLF